MPKNQTSLRSWIKKYMRNRCMKKEIDLCAFICAQGGYQPSSYQSRVKAIKAKYGVSK